LLDVRAVRVFRERDTVALGEGAPAPEGEHVMTTTPAVAADDLALSDSLTVAEDLTDPDDADEPTAHVAFHLLDVSGIDPS
jgi:hypothetical protein